MTGRIRMAALALSILFLAGPAFGQFQVFVTDSGALGNFGGLANADSACNVAAGNAALSGTWVAWLSDSQTNAIDRLTGTGCFFLR